MREFRKVHQFNAFSVNTPMQAGLAEYLSEREAYLGLGPDMQSRRDLFISLMQDTPFTLMPSHGSYFMLATYERFSNDPDQALAVRLTRELGVATIPVSAFYQDGTDNRMLRFCFCKKPETLEEACHRLRRL